MKGKQLLLLLVLVVVLGGAGYFLQKSNQSAWSAASSGAGGKVLEFPINDVAHLHVKTPGAELTLSKKDDAWLVKERADYPANFEQVSALLRKLWDLKTVQEVKVGASQLARLELAEPGKEGVIGTLIELKGKDGKRVGGVQLGKKHLRKGEAPGPMGDMGAFPAGRYVLPLDGKRVSLVSETFEEVDPAPERWLRKDFIKIENPKTITLAGQTEGLRWSVTRENASAEWKLANAKPEEQLDGTKVSPIATALAHPNFKDVLAPDAKPEETGLDKPVTVTIETFDGFVYTLNIGKLTHEAYPARLTVTANLAKERTPAPEEKAEDKQRLDDEFAAARKRLEEKLAAERKFEARPYLLEKSTVESLLKERTALLAEKTPAPAASPSPAAPAPPSVTTPPAAAPAP